MIEKKLKVETWLITGVAGFIGSNLLEFLLKNNQKVIGIDNFSSGYKENLDKVKKIVGDDLWKNFDFEYGEIEDINICEKIFSKSIDYVLHQAALGSVPRSIKKPIQTNNANINGFLNILDCCRRYNIKKLVFASSSSVYGDSETLPKTENLIGEPLNPYAVTKIANEIYANVYNKSYGTKVIGLRYFNVFGPRQDPNGAYAAVIPKWINNYINGENIEIYGDGKTSRDFCYIDNVVLANYLAAKSKINCEIFNVANSETHTLIELDDDIKQNIKMAVNITSKRIFKQERMGDIKHSLASIEKIKSKIGYSPVKSFKKGLTLTCEFYLKEANIK